MPIRKATGNMYGFVTHIWNPVKGKCGYDCSYCYVKKIFKRFGKQQEEPYLDEKELYALNVRGGYVFVCSSCDLFHDDIPSEWIRKVRSVTEDNPAFDNRYLWHTKNPKRALEFQDRFGDNDILCVTIESNYGIWGDRGLYAIKYSEAPSPEERFEAIRMWKKPWMLTIEPVMDFDLHSFTYKIYENMPVQVNIGADSGRNNLPEPSPEKLRELIGWLESKGVAVHRKKNLGRLLSK